MIRAAILSSNRRKKPIPPPLRQSSISFCQCPSLFRPLTVYDKLQTTVSQSYPYAYFCNRIALSLSSSKIDRLHPQWSCRHLYGLTRKQLRFCRRNIEQMDSIRAGAQLAYSECQYQFQQRRFICHS
ncbi:hypothetical protein WUBG_11427 [Wuchereria bancrofti]|uniref:Protein Wnt n=1 Tax=Wuchereria bancrofti TaxID=6293 RepID=J9EQV8_WUCBA|nr:hypothetical protein WUBG_11427 [Wuchereria bancrofti]